MASSRKEDPEAIVTIIDSDDSLSEDENFEEHSIPKKIPKVSQAIVTIIDSDDSLSEDENFEEHSIPKKIPKKRAMVYKEAISPALRAYILHEVQDNKLTAKEIAKKCGVSWPTVYGIKRRGIHGLKEKKAKSYSPGRPRKVSFRTERSIIRYFKKLRQDNANFTSRKLFEETIWNKFQWNPAAQARAPGARIWRKRSEGTAFCCTSKGKKEGTGGKVARLFVSISYGNGVIACHTYQKLDGCYFEEYVKKHFENLFNLAGKESARLWLQDGDPSQNCRGVKKAIKSQKAELFSIPPRSPDLNPIENLFHLVREQLDEQAIGQNITRETFDDFQGRIII
ncbi:hypothetical protein AC249_AIPGENE21540 [Exaiptasia diaphana]|nr:hypothetical protein AC249_AIPGENE21540 [Exaiptasia diaphana]